MSDPAEILAAAHDYRKRGWRVIQLHHVGGTMKMCGCERGGNCTSAGKHPINRKWQDSPVPSAADVEAMWEKRPKANVGLAVGEPGGFWILDIDPDHGGFESMQALVEEHGKLPETFTTQSGSGGYHYYFPMPDFELRNTSGQIGKGIDTRANGGQVVAAPSETDKGVYTIVRDLPLAPAPDWLIEAARKVEVDPDTIVTAKDLPKPEDIAPAEWERLNKYALRAIESERERLRKLGVEGWSGEPWNHTTFEVACALLEFANSPWNAYSLGHAEQDVMTLTPRDGEGFDDYTVRKTFNSAKERIGDKARAMPEDRKRDPDPLFEGVRENPTQGGGTEGSPVAGPSPYRFFHDKDGLLADRLADAVMAESPLAYGRDDAFWSYHDGVWAADPHVVEARCVKLLGPLFRNAHASNASTVVRHSVIYLDGEPQPRWINFANGMLDWRTGELLGHDANLKSTVQINTTYEPDATCPTFDGFLSEVMHPDYVALAWEMLGYLLYSGNPMQMAFLFYGSGGNGKGTLMRVIERMLGAANIASESLDDLNNNRFRTANLFGKIANLTGDIDATYQENTAQFKKITGEDVLTGERKNRDPFRFTSWAVPVFSANKFPGSADVTEGYLRRWTVLHFHKRIENMVPGLSDLLVEELPGIAYKATTALQSLMMRGRFHPDGEAVKGIEEFAKAIDSVRQWLASGEVMQAPEVEIAVGTLYANYNLWASRSGQRPVKEAEFSHRLEGIGYILKGHAHVGIKPAPIDQSTGTFFNQ